MPIAAPPVRKGALNGWDIRPEASHHHHLNLNQRYENPFYRSGYKIPAGALLAMERD